MIILTYTKLIFRDRGLKKARIFFLRSLLFYPKLAAWLEFIDLFYKSYGFVLAPSNLASLPVRSYASSIFFITMRVKILQDHYLEMKKIFSSAVIRKFLLEKDNEITISSLLKKDGNPCYLKILMHAKFWREGAMTIFLSNEANELIASLTFTICHDLHGKKSIFIGGLQGGSDIEKSDIVKITRGLGGLRPKHALIECCYTIASFVGAEAIIGVSNKNHVLSYQRNFQKSYDDIWKEIGGELMEDGNYLLPKFLAKRDFGSVPQKKRKDWLIRHGHLDKLHLDITNFLKESSKK